MTDMNPTTGCGSGCGCAATPEPVPHRAPVGVARINRVALHPPGATVDPARLRELACAELLRQEAVRQGLLADSRSERWPDIAPELDAQQREQVAAMVEREIRVPQATTEACRRYYDANRQRFVSGQALRLRHVLFAVTPAVDVQALARRAEALLLELQRDDAEPQRFAQRARELSNCPSGQDGGDLGWVEPHDCVPELAAELFFRHEPALGLQPRLLQTRFGLHIVEVLQRRSGRLAEFDAVSDRIEAQLALEARVTATRQYLQLLAGAADVQGIVLDAADSPLLQ